MHAGEQLPRCPPLPRSASMHLFVPCGAQISSSLFDTDERASATTGVRHSRELAAFDQYSLPQA